ncbi:hypothetical protein MJO29_005937 [Puccinia striiformis f. sp. tritici]|nr:hypothetical protein MJO29_005937 [Puccinia striiformis f. sp. tritici]
MQDSTTRAMADKDEDPVEQPKIPCKKCDKMFFTDGMRKTHVRKEHQDSVKVTLHNGTQATVNREPDKGFSCPTPRCTSVSTNPNNLQSHARACTPQKVAAALNFLSVARHPPTMVPFVNQISCQQPWRKNNSL